MSATRPPHLDPSELGTKEYWDKLYEAELQNHASDPSDIGTVWFDDSDAEEKMLSFLNLLTGDKEGCEEEEVELNTSMSPNGNLVPVSLNKNTTSVLDLGCGNGSMLISLHEQGWKGTLLGVDYSAKSVSLANQVFSARKNSSSSQRIDFVEWDVLDGSLSNIMEPLQISLKPPSVPDIDDTGIVIGWDVVLDKGTFDAISLNAATDQHGRRWCEGYRERVLALLRPGGILLITSCNWTEEELHSWFLCGSLLPTAPTSPEQRDGSDFTFVILGRVKYRSFSFGGIKGQAISTVCFQKSRCTV